METKSTLVEGGSKVQCPCPRTMSTVGKLRTEAEVKKREEREAPSQNSKKEGGRYPSGNRHREDLVG